MALNNGLLRSPSAFNFCDTSQKLKMPVVIAPSMWYASGVFNFRENAHKQKADS